MLVELDGLEIVDEAELAGGLLQGNERTAVRRAKIAGQAFDLANLTVEQDIVACKTNVGRAHTEIVRAECAKQSRGQQAVQNNQQ